MPTLALPDWDVHYQRIGERAGTRNDVVLIHGLGANLAFWYLGGGRHLANTRPLLLYDLRGHGRSSMPATNYRLPSMAEDLARLIDHLGLDKVHVVGHSFGGRVALAFAGLYPEKVRSLVIADTQIRTLQPSMRLADWPHWPKWKAELMALGLKDPPPDDSLIDFKLLSELNKYGGNVAVTGRTGPALASGGAPGGGSLAAPGTAEPGRFGGRLRERAALRAEAEAAVTSDEAASGRPQGGLAAALRARAAERARAEAADGSAPLETTAPETPPEMDPRESAMRDGGLRGALAWRGPSGRVMEGDGGPARRISLRSREMGARGQQAWNTMLATTTASADFEDEAPLEGDFFSRVDMPTLLLFGAYSHCLPTAHGLLERLPRARLVEIPRAGHFFPVVEPVRFTRAVERFLAINEAIAEGETPQALRGPRAGAGRLRAAALRRAAERLRETEDDGAAAERRDDRV